MPHKTIKQSECPHLGEMKIMSSEKKACEARSSSLRLSESNDLPDGQVCGERENLRLCTSCGSVFCCQSHQAHNEAHFNETKHPIIVPLPTGTPLAWIWCWVCNAYLE